MYIRATKWYQSTITGKYLWDFEAMHTEEQIYGPERFEELLKTGILKEVEPPPLRLLIRLSKIETVRQQDVI